jgi:Flp pilus assembly protein TadG
VRPQGQEGQSTVELALALPFLVLLALVLLQVGLVVRDQVLVTHAAREAAREAAVRPGEGPAREAALESARFDEDELEVDLSSRGHPGTRVRATVTYESPTDVPLVGALIGSVHLEATATMRIET